MYDATMDAGAKPVHIETDEGLSHFVNQQREALLRAYASWWLSAMDEENPHVLERHEKFQGRQQDWQAYRQLGVPERNTLNLQGQQLGAWVQGVMESIFCSYSRGTSMQDKTVPELLQKIKVEVFTQMHVDAAEIESGEVEE